MDKFLIRQPKRQKVDTDAALTSSTAVPTGAHPPSTIMTWNANSIKLRTERNECGGLVKMMDAEGVEALFLQETRLKPGDQSACEAALRRAGLSNYTYYWSNHPSKRYSGTACIVRSDRLPLRVTYSLTPHIPSGTPSYSTTQDTPDMQARVVLLEYERCFLLNLYVPLCSWYADGRAQRDIWDTRLMAALQQLQRRKPVVVVGDLNVCHQPLDVSHPSFFATARLPGNAGKPGAKPALPGQPGYTELERQRFTELLAKCQLVDTFRELHGTAQRLTWGFSSNFQTGIYKDKYMGLDYILAPRQYWEEGRVLRSIVGGPEAAFGSDHCVVLGTIRWGEVAGDADGGSGAATADGQQPPPHELQQTRQQQEQEQGQEQPQEQGQEQQQEQGQEQPQE